ncbi:MAG: acetyl-CoA carboxylase biotin carboxyl carrier protein subunit [Actinomycetota bacterium]|nr:acetyl-CoA carboxylase biotin carboxyl carrier protein subunit [Acidimicrobiales bacterium]MEC9426283.1 acetyl-CoA carboxylase biotin carboxyl carrier protein subunit [Actinomycetota bacterium]
MLSIELESPVTGVIWKVMAAVGTTVAPGDPVVVVESMKTEIPIESTRSGTVAAILVCEGDRVSEDDPVAIVDVT